MDQAINAARLTVPERLRAIFGVWGQPCDPAPRTVAADGVVLYQTLAASAQAVLLDDATLQQIEADACYNAEYGQFAELRREGRQVLPWVRALRAAGPAPCQLFVPY